MNTNISKTNKIKSRGRYEMKNNINKKNLHSNSVLQNSVILIRTSVPFGQLREI